MMTLLHLGGEMKCKLLAKADKCGGPIAETSPIVASTG